MKYEIKSLRKAILYTLDCKNFKKCAEAAVRNGTALNGADLMRADLEGANLNGADLRGAHLWCSNLNGAELNDANLQGANLNGASLRGARLVNANLRDTSVIGVSFANANLRGADFGDARMGDTYFSGADLKGTSFEGVDFDNGTTTTFRDAKGILSVPSIPMIDVAIEDAIDAGGKLKMGDWHGPENNWCGSTHCRAGWAVHIAGKEGKKLQDQVGVHLAAILIYQASRPDTPAPDFFCFDDEAMADIRKCAAEQRGKAR